MEPNLVTQPQNSIPGSLARHWKEWKKLGTVSNLMLRWIKEGVPIQFRSLPFPTILNNRQMSTQHQQYVDQEIIKLLQSGAISQVNQIPTVVSPIGVVPKKNGKLRMIIDLRYVNTFIQVTKFRNEDLSTLAPMLQPGDYLQTADLQDGYFHVPIKQKYRTYLGFQWRGKFYQYNVLPFGLAPSPWIFTKLVRPVIQYLRKKGIRILAYMDDFILMAKTITEATLHRRIFLKTLEKLGWFISIEKSHLILLHKQEFLGMIVDTASAPQYKIPSKKFHEIKHQVSRILKISSQEKIPVRHIARIAGKSVTTNISGI